MLVQNLPHRIMRLILLISDKMEGLVDGFLIVFVCLYMREKKERNRKEKREEERRERGSLVFRLVQREKKNSILTIVTAKKKVQMNTIYPACN